MQFWDRPEAFQEELAGISPQATHAGVLAAAAAVAADLARHRILDLLLDGPGDARPGPRTGLGFVSGSASHARGRAGGLADSAERGREEGGAGPGYGRGCAERVAAPVSEHGRGEAAKLAGGREETSISAGGRAETPKLAGGRAEAERWDRSIAAIRRRRLDCRVSKAVTWLSRVCHACMWLNLVTPNPSFCWKPWVAACMHW